MARRATPSGALGDVHADGEVVGETGLVDRVAHAAERPRLGVVAGINGSGKAENLHGFWCCLQGLVSRAMFALTRNWSSWLGSLLK
jgi:hypothetical protein